MKRGRNMKKLLIAGLMALVLCGCSQALDGSFNEAELLQAATVVLENLSKGKYEEITETVSQDLQTALSEEILESAWAPLGEKLGVYKGVAKTKVVGNKDKSATVILLADYEKGKMQLTVTYNEQMEIIGLYVK